MSNLINKNENVNNKQSPEFNYFSLNKRVYDELMLTPRPKAVLFKIMVHIACKCITYKNGLVGVHSEISKTGLAKDLGINKGHITGYLKQLEEMQFIKIFNESPLVFQVLEVPVNHKYNDIQSLLLYVSTNPRDFNFHANLERKKAFFEIFKEHEEELFKSRMQNAEVPEGHKDMPTDEEIEDIFGFKPN